MTRTVLASAAVILVLCVFMGYYAWRNVVESRERRRLAQFPERNPLPVFSLSPGGEVVYANPAAYELAAQLFHDASQVSRLLPEVVRQGGLSGRERSSREYPVGQAILHCGIHCMADLGVCHAYVRDITAQRQAESRLRYLAMHDAVTDLPNLRGFQERLDEMLASRQPGALLLLHLERYRSVVDTLGHAQGDAVLRAVGERLAARVAADAALCCVHRIEGELFGMLLNGGADGMTPEAMAGQIAAGMQAAVLIETRALFFSFSIGTSVFPQDGEDRDTLLRRADAALRQAMRAGSGFMRYDAQMDHRALERLETEHALRHAEQRGELELHYQPQLTLASGDASGHLVGVEALVRWRHPQKGLVSPAEFIPLAEETGMIVPMGIWILASACAQNKAWQDAGLPPMVVAVNLSPRQFADPELPALVRRVLAETGLAPAWLELEVTEGAAMHDLKQAIATLHAFKALGVRLSIDDFGTGYSSLAYLSRFPIDKLKLDQSFVRNMVHDPGDAAIARAVVTLGRGLGLTVIAEGVETAEQRERLSAFGCHEVQGYLYSRPLSAGAIPAFVAAQSNAVG